MSGKLFKDLMDVIDNEYAGVAEDGLDADVTGFIDTGSYALNLQLSGDMFEGGIPANKVTGIAGAEATGKTYFLLGIMKAFQDKDPDAVCVIFDTEQAISKQLLESRKIDTKRVLIVPVGTVQEFRTQASRVVEHQLSIPESHRKPMLTALDSLGNLSTTKEMTDVIEGSEKKDMTRAQLLRGTFRVLTLKLGQAGIPMIVTNHTYDKVGAMFPTKEMAGGGGLKYAASTIIFLAKAKYKDGKDVIGDIIHSKQYKSRITKPFTVIDTRLSYDKGLDRYYGLVDMAIDAGIFKKVSTKVQVSKDKKVFRKALEKNPEKYFTQEILEQINEKAKGTFCYGSDLELVDEEDE